MKRILIGILTAIVTVSVALSCTVIGAVADSPKYKIGDVLTSIPRATVKNKVQITDTSNVKNGELKMSWEAIEGASSYSVRVLYNVSLKEKADTSFIYEQEIKTTETTANITELKYCRRYTIVVYGIDSDGNDIATYNYAPVFTYPKSQSVNNGKPTKTESHSNASLSTEEIIFIAAAAALVVITIVFIVVIIMLKKPAQKKE